MKKRQTAKFRVALGQVGLLISILLVAILLGLVPDRRSAIREGRAVLAEAVDPNPSTPSPLVWQGIVGLIEGVKFLALQIKHTDNLLTTFDGHRQL